MKTYLVYLLAFLFTLHITPSYFINSSFLEQFVGESTVGYIYTVGSILALSGLFLAKKMMGRVGNYRIFLGSILTSFTAYIVLSTSLIVEPSDFWATVYVIFYIASFISHSISFFTLDVFLEKLTKNSETGGVRGIYLTAINSSFIVGPLIAGIMISGVSEAGKIYALGATLLLPVIYIALKYFRDFEDPQYVTHHFFSTLKYVRGHKNLRHIFSATFILNLFYAVMVIYTPIFLNSTIGLSIGQIGTIMGIALIPFVLSQSILGRIADKKYGEKEILVLGFLIMGLSTAAMSFFSTDSFIFWAALLFITRVGASMVEIMCDTYLFKKIDESDVNVISLYRSMLPVGYIFAPLFASIFLLGFDIRYLFVTMGIITLWGVRYALAIRDTK